MKRLLMSVALIGSLSIVIAMLILLRGTPRRTRASTSSTSVCGTITTTTTWSIISSPIVLCNSFAVVVNQGVTLTIQPGVVVQSGSGSGLSVNGTLIAIGTPTQTIAFTGTTPGSWQGIMLNGSVTQTNRSVLDDISIEYAGLGSGHGAIELNSTDAIIKHTSIISGGGNGIYAYTSGGGYAGGSPNISDVSFQNNTGYPLWFTDFKANPILNRLSATGNTSGDVVALSAGSISGTFIWGYTGLPYRETGSTGFSVPAGSSLSIEPGVEVQFGSTTALVVYGQLIAAGSAAQPITFTGIVSTPGYWRGLEFDSGSAAQIDYATIEYGGYGASANADVIVNNGQVSIKHSVIQNSLHDGVYIYGANTIGSSIFGSKIISNTGAGISNTVPAHPIMATNNWWGASSGPTSDIGCGSGIGSRVSAGVIFKPVLTASNAIPPIVPLSDAAIVSLTPRRWFAPADGSTRVYLDLNLHDGDGNPIPNRNINVLSSLGGSSVITTGVTDQNGHTFAYMTSTSQGDANVYANLATANNCEDATSPVSKITFTAPLTYTDLMPNSQAPYVSGDLDVGPAPIIRGITSTIYARLTNTSTVPITIDVEFDFVQSSIGLAFGPIGSLNNQVIQSNSTITLTQDWLPIVDGHYCIKVHAHIVAIGSLAASKQPMQTLPDFDKQKNLNVNSGGMKNADQQNSIDKARNSSKVINKFVEKTYEDNPFAIPLAIANKGIEIVEGLYEKASNALFGDPPTQTYKLIDLPHKISITPTLPISISMDRANAINAYADALATLTSYAQAAATANDRYGGAAEAHDLQWASLQSAALLDYRTHMAEWAITTSLKLNDLIAEAAGDGVTSLPISVDDVRAMQLKLSSSGWMTQEVIDMQAFGYTDDDIEALRQDIITTDPNLLAGDFIVYMQTFSNDLYHMGNSLLQPEVFNPGFSVSGSAGMLAAQTVTPTGNTMAQMFNSESTFLLSNPLSTTSVIDLKSRRIDLPADWMINVSPAQSTLSPSETITVTVTLMPGSAIPQGSLPQVAVEGYVGSQLLGGVAINVVVPNYDPYFWRVFLPLVKK